MDNVYCFLKTSNNDPAMPAILTQWKYQILGIMSCGGCCIQDVGQMGPISYLVFVFS